MGYIDDLRNEYRKLTAQPTQPTIKADSKTIDALRNEYRALTQPVHQPVTQPVQPITTQVTQATQPVKSHAGVAQANDRARTIATPMTDKINSGASLTPEEVVRLAQEQGRISQQEADYQVKKAQAAKTPLVNTYANQANYEANKTTTRLDKKQGEIEAKEELENINNDNIATTYVETKDKLANAKANKDTRQISKNENILKGIKQEYKAEDRDVDVVSSRKDYEAWSNTIAHDLDNYKNAATPEQKQLFGQVLLRDKAEYDRAYKKYAEDLTYDEIKNNNIIKDSASSFEKNVLGGTANIINAGFTGLSTASGYDASKIDANELYNFVHNNEKFNLDTNFLTDLTGQTYLESPVERLALLKGQNPYNKRLDTLFRQIATKTYKGTAEDIQKELDQIQKEIYQNFKDVYTQDELDAVADQIRHNEIYGELAAIPNAFGTTGNMVPSILIGTATGGLGEALGGGAMAAGGTVANTLQQVGAMGSLGLGAYSQAMDEALQNGALYNQAQLYGALSGATEVGTEMLGGETVNRFLGQTGKTALGKLFGKAIDNLNIESKVGRIVASTLSDVAGESTEEMISEALNPLWKAITYDANALPKNAEELQQYFSDILKAGAEAIPSTLLMQGAGVAGNVVKVQQVENGIIKSINESDLSQIVKNQLISEVRKASTDVKLGLEEADYMTDKMWEKNANLTAQSEQMKQRIPEGYSLPQSTIDILSYTENNRPGLNIAFDTNVQGNGSFVENPDGTRTITLNPNSKRAVEFTLTHELGHDLKGTGEYTQLQNLLTDYAKGKPGYQEALNQLDKTYRESGANYNLQDEATNDMLGQAIGEQEFYNKLAENPTLFNRVTNGLKNLLGNKDTKLKNKIEKLTSNALKQEYRGKQEGVKQSISEKVLKDNKGRKLTTEQKNFFNEISPEMLDNKGNIVTLYHASQNDFDTFDKNKIRSGVTMYANSGDGFYFTDSQNEANKYGKGTGKVYEVYLNLKHPLLVENNLSNEAKQILTDFSKLMLEKHKAEIEKESFGKYQEFNPNEVGQRSGGAILSSVVRNYGDEFTEYLKSLGYDGIKESVTDYNNTGAKYNYIAFEPEQIKDVTNEKPTSNPNMHYSLSEAPTQDNQGRELSKGQQTYFRDSKVRDENGNLIEVYHGSPNEFTKFDRNKTSREARTSQYGTGFYFTNRKNIANEYKYQSNAKNPTTFKVYLKIENPFIMTRNNEDEHRLSREGLKQLLIEGDNKWFFDSWIPFVTKTTDKLNYRLDGLTEEQIQNLNKEEKVDYYLRQEYDRKGFGDKHILEEMHKAYTNNSDLMDKFPKYLGYDGIIAKGTMTGVDQYIVFNPNQIKNVDNLNPTENEDIRYSKQNSSWQDFLDKNYNWATGEKSYFEGLPSNEELVQNVSKSVENEPILGKTLEKTAKNEQISKDVDAFNLDEPVELVQSDDPTLFSLTEKQVEEITDYIRNLEEDDSIDNEFKNKILDKFDNVGSYRQFSDIRNEVDQYKERANKAITGLVDIANMKEEDVKQKPLDYLQYADKNTSNQRKFFENMESSPIIAEETKNRVNQTNYEQKKNLSTLDKVREKLDEQGNSLIDEWKTKTKKFTDEDVALGAILVERYQQQGDFESAARAVEKLADIGTEAGRAVQMYSIFQRLTPETMALYEQKALNKAFEEMKEKKTGKWVEQNKDKFKLTAEDTEFIKEQVEKASQAIDDETKQRELSKIENRINDKLPPESGDAIKTLRRIAMLFNPKTQVRNIAGNTLIMPVNDVADLVGTAIDKLVSKKTGVRTTGIPNPVAKTKGFAKGVKQAVKDYKTGTRTAYSGNKWEMELGAKPFNEHTDNKALNAVNTKLNKLNDFLSAIMSGGDRPFFEGAYNNSLQAQMKANKVTEPTQDMIDIAVNEGLQRTWNDNNEYTKTVLAIRKAMNKLNIHGFGLGDLIIPFAKTPANLTKAMVEYSPAGFIPAVSKFVDMSKAISRGEMTAQQQKNFVSSMSKAIAGTMLYAIAGTLARGIGDIKTTGSADDDKDVKNFEQNVLGIQPYSVRLGDKTYTYSWANPINAPLAIMADSYKLSKEDASLADQIYNAIKVAGNVLLDNSFLQGIAEIFNNQDGPVAGLVDSITSMPESLVPTFVSQIASAFDDTKRQTFEYKDELGTIGNKIKSKLPGARNTLAPQVNTFGEEIENQNNWFNVFFNPANVREADITDSQKALYEVYEQTKDKTIFPMQAPYYTNNSNGEKVNLSSQDRVTYQKASGNYASSVYDDLFNLDAFNDSYHINNEAKADILKEIASDANAKGREAVGAISAENNSNLAKLNEKIDTLEEAGIPLADYYIAWYVQKEQKKKQGKKTAISQQLENELTQDQKKALYEIFNVN